MTIDDLNPDALAKLEAKMVADLEMVRKVRALLEEHRIPLPGVGPSAVAPGVASVAAATPAPVVQVPQPPRKSFVEVLTEALKAMPAEGFNLGALKESMRKAGLDPMDSAVKLEMNRLIRHGKVVVVKSVPGRIGSTYRYVPPMEASAESGSAAAAAPPADAEKRDPLPVSGGANGK